MIKHPWSEGARKRGSEGASARTLVSSPPRLLVLCSALCFLLSALPSLAQTYQQEEDTQSGALPPAAAPEVYHESALRRFEIVFTISLPFTAFHSYLAVRGVGILRQRKVSPELHRADWNAVGGLTILFSGFVAFWDYLHTRGEDVSEKKIMTTGKPEGQKAGEPESRLPGLPAFWLSGYPELRFLSIEF